MADRSARLSLCLCAFLAALAILSLTPGLAQTGPAEDNETVNQPVPCGVDAVVGSLRILGIAVDQAAIEDMTSFYQPPNTMSLLDVTQMLRSHAGVEAKVWETSYAELQSLDQPVVVHLTGSGCSECPEGGHVIAVERLAGEWAIVQGVMGTSLASARQISGSFGGHAVLLSAPPLGALVGPKLYMDSYVCDLGNVTAGQDRLCRLTIRNQGTDLLAVRGGGHRCGRALCSRARATRSG